MTERPRCELSAHHCLCLRIMIALLCINKDNKKSYLHEFHFTGCMAFGVTAVPFLSCLWAWWFSAQPQGLLLQMVKKNKATRSPGIIDLRVLQGVDGEGCVMLFACFFVKNEGWSPKKWWGKVGRGVNKPKFKNEAFEKKQTFFFQWNMSSSNERNKAVA